MWSFTQNFFSIAWFQMHSKHFPRSHVQKPNRALKNSAIDFIGHSDSKPAVNFNPTFYWNHIFSSSPSPLPCPLRSLPLSLSPSLPPCLPAPPLSLFSCLFSLNTYLLANAQCEALWAGPAEERVAVLRQRWIMYVHQWDWNCMCKGVEVVVYVGVCKFWVWAGDSMSW